MTDINYLAHGDQANRSWPPHKSPAEILRGWFGRWTERHAPVGYEDEAGFHYGTPPVPHESRRPRVQN